MDTLPSAARRYGPGGRQSTGGGSRPQRIERGSHHAAEVTGATYRQVDYWIRLGLLGDDQKDLGSGRRRTFTDHDLEVLYALIRLASLGCRDQWMVTAADCLRAERVQHGEVLVVNLANTAERCTDMPTIWAPAWVVRLAPFDDGHPA